MDFKVSSLIKTSSGLGVLMIIGYGISFLKESSIAYYFGVSPEVDAYTIAIQVPIILYSVFSVAIKSVLIPIYSKCFYNEDKIHSDAYISNFISIVLVLSLFFSIIGSLFASPIIYLFAPGFEEYRHTIATNLLRWSFLTLFCTAYSEIVTGVLNVHKKFAIPSLGVWIWNLIIIMTIILLNNLGVCAAVIGNAIGLICEFIFMMYILKKQITYKFVINLRDKFIQDSLKKTLPVMLGIGAAEVNRMVDRVMASIIGVGSISILNYASKISTVFAGMLEQTVTVVAFPYFAEFSAKKEYSSLSKLLNICLTGFTLVLIPITIYTILFNDIIVDIAFGRGKFSQDDVIMTGSVLLYFALGLFFLCMRSLLTNIFYSLEDTKTPSYNSIVGIIVNIVLNIILGYIMGIQGLALATSLSLFVIFILLLFQIRKYKNFISLKEFYSNIYKPIIAGGVLTITFLFFENILEKKSLNIIVSFIVSIFLYLIVLYLLKTKELVIIINLIRKANGKTNNPR